MLFVSSSSFHRYYYYNQLTFFICALHFDSILGGPAIDESLVDYDVIDETDPYYCSINEFDMLGNFDHEIADQAAFGYTMTSPASGSPPTPVMCAQKLLDYTEIREK